MNLPTKNENSEKSALNFSLKSILIFIIIALAIYLLIPKLLNEKYVLTLMLQVKKPYLLLALLCEIISYSGSAFLMGIILSRLGYKISFKDRFRLGSIAAFAIHFFPISGVGESAVDFYFLRKRKVSAGSILLMFILRTIITYAAFLILFAFALIVVPSLPDLAFSPRIVCLIIFLFIFLGVLYLIMLYRNKDRFHRVLIRLSKFVNKFFKFFKKSPIDESKVDEVYHDVYDGIGLFAGQKRSTIGAILGGLTYWLGDMMCLYFVFLSFGYAPRLGIIIFGYCIATLAGLISLIPGGLGVTEGSMSLIISALGIPLKLAVTAVLVFRFFSFWIWIPVGLISYITLQRETKKD